MTTPQAEKLNALYTAFLQLKTVQEVQAFCTDIMTPQEIEALADRWQVAQELAKGKSQRVVSAETGVSIATVTRVNRALTRGAGGYKTVISRTHHHDRIHSAAS
jgi:TrpR-related protein YerC/YecD